MNVYMGNRAIVSVIFNLGTRWRQVLYCLAVGKESRYFYTKRLECTPQNVVIHFGDDNIFLTLPGFEHPIIQVIS
jgi:hypothetical protein